MPQVGVASRGVMRLELVMKSIVDHGCGWCARYLWLNN